MIHAAMQHAMRSPLQSAMDRMGSAVWTPATLFAASEQGVWYDPSDLSTLFQDSAGTTPVTAVGQPVGLMLDKSGRGNHATQATAAARPVLQQDANGKYYLAFDGVDDSMATAAINFTATDKMSVFAGVHKASDVGFGTIVELSVEVASNPGSFLMRGPQDGGNYFVGSRGSLEVYRTLVTYSAPVTNTIAMVSNIAAPLLQTRVNSTVVDTSNVAQGTGNFGNYPLFIGRRGGTSLPFNGRIYSLIVRGALSDAAQIAAAEAYVNSKTGAY